jgi:hypothetical protein
MLRAPTLLTLALIGCGGGGAAPAEEPAPAPTAADLGPLCDRHYQRQRECVDEYLSALLDARVEYDMPPGIAAEVEAEGRDAALVKTRADWEEFTTPDNVDAICRAMEQTPEDQVERLYRQGEACAATTDCAAWARCAVDDERSYIQSGATH